MRRSFPRGVKRPCPDEEDAAPAARISIPPLLRKPSPSRIEQLYTAENSLVECVRPFSVLESLCTGCFGRSRA